MPVARAQPAQTRVIAHVDLDCFYVQVEQRRRPEFKGKPTAVVMYNPWKGGGIIAVGYEARGFGVTRNMRGDDARRVCPDINLIQVPTHFGKADLTVYRDAGSEVVAVFSRGGVCERASIDEVYLDITEAATARVLECPPDAVQSLSGEVLRTHIVGLGEDEDERIGVKDWLCRSNTHASRSDQLLACGAMIIAELRTAVYEETGFSTSAGIAHNKMLAKLASGMHKPAQQTLIPTSGAPVLLASLPTKKIKGLGGKLGKALGDLGIQTIGELLPFSESKLQDLYGINTGTWLWRVARGMNGEEVEGRILPKSHGCGKTFPGPKCLKDLDSVRHWLSELSEELQERLDLDLQQNNRTAGLLVCHAACHLIGKGTNPMKLFPSKSCALRYGKEKIASDAFLLFKRALSEFCPSTPSLSPGKGAGGTAYQWGVTALTLSANRIVDASGTVPITQFFETPATIQGSKLPMVTTTPPSSPSASPSSAEESEHHERLLVGSPIRDSSFIKGPQVTNVMRALGISRNASAESAKNPFDTGHVSPIHSSACRRPTIDEFNDGDVGCTDRNLLESGEPSSVQNGNVLRQDHPEITPSNTQDTETGLSCTPKFGVPGRSLQELDPVLICDSVCVCSGIEEHGAIAPEEVWHGANPSWALNEVVACSPLEYAELQATKTDSGCTLEVNKEGIMDETTAYHKVERGYGITMVSDSCLKWYRQSFSEHATSSPSSATEMLSATQAESMSDSKSIQSKVEKGKSVSIPSREVPASSSKRLVFQRVDDLLGKSRPSTRILPTTEIVGNNFSSWNYNQNEIDASVLAELPEDIQDELRNQLGLKRPKPDRRSRISDFFRVGPDR